VLGRRLQRYACAMTSQKERILAGELYISGDAELDVPSVWRVLRRWNRRPELPES